MDTAEELRAIEDIKQLKARYFRHIDFKQWDRFRTLFCPDLVVEAPDGSGRSATIQAIRERSTAPRGFSAEWDRC